MRDGDDDAAAELLPHIYDELHRVARGCFRGQPADHTLQPTALAHEAYMRLVDQTSADYADRMHFMSVAATAMRRILIDHARARRAEKRGGGWNRVDIDAPGDSSDLDRIDVLALDEALKELSTLDERQARVVELRFFGGLSVKETAEVLGVSPRTIDFDWKMARAWLSQTLASSEEG